jgi:hypothetical protein
MSKNWNYRQELIKNADNIIHLNQSALCEEQPTFKKETSSSNTPFLYTSCTDKAMPVGYENSDMKQSFLMKQQKKCTMISPEIHLK